MRFPHLRSGGRRGAGKGDWGQNGGIKGERERFDSGVFQGCTSGSFVSSGGCQASKDARVGTQRDLAVGCGGEIVAATLAGCKVPSGEEGLGHLQVVSVREDGRAGGCR